MSRNRKSANVKRGLDGWVMTYGDMMSLLLTFFVLIVSFSSLQETKFKQAASSLREAFGVLASPESVIQFNDRPVPEHNPQAKDPAVLYEVRAIEKFILEADFDQQIVVEVRDEGVLFRLNAPFLFASGTADLAVEPQGVLEEMARFFAKFPYKVEIDGHTDSVPINSLRYPSNWELSAARAVTVARYFQSIGMAPERIAATGYGEFHPIADNTTPEGREKNRRVEIFLHLNREALSAEQRLLFEESPVRLERIEWDQRKEPDEKPSVRPIIDPVTGKLGTSPVKR